MDRKAERTVFVCVYKRRFLRKYDLPYDLVKQGNLGAQARSYLLGSAFRGPGLLVFVTVADPPAFYGLGQLWLENNGLWHFNKKTMVRVAMSSDFPARPMSWKPA